MDFSSWKLITGVAAATTTAAAGLSLRLVQLHYKLVLEEASEAKLDPEFNLTTVIPSKRKKESAKS